MIRKIIKIDEEKCTGCGLCVTSCHEKAIEIIDGKAKLIKDDYCDGLGDCLKHCPSGALRIILKDTVKYDEEQVKARINDSSSFEYNWPIQIKLVNPESSFLENCDLLICATCSGFSYNHIKDEMKNKATLIGCPKLDGVDYSIKLTEIIRNNNIKSISIIKMEVPCCNGLYGSVVKAIKNANKDIKLKVKTIKTNGEVL